MTNSSPAGRRNWGRVAGTIGAQLSNQAVTVATQLVMVPVLLSAWGVERYGAWLLLSAIPTYLTLTDFGFTAIAKNEMTMSVARGQRDAALRTYHSIFALLSVIGLVVLATIGLGVGLVRLTALWPLAATTETQAKTVLLLLCANVLLYQFMLLGSAGARCVGRPAQEVLWGAAARLAEAILAGAAAWLGGDIVMAALAMLASRLVFTVAMFVWLRQIAPWLTLSLRQRATQEMHRLLGPSLSYMCYIAGHAVIGQGPVLVLGSIAGPHEVVVFSTTRTLARLGVSAANILTLSLTPEYSRLYGAGNHGGFRRLVMAGAGLVCAGTLVYGAALHALGALLLEHWTGGKVPLVEPFFSLLLLAVAGEMVWSAGFAPLAAINRHLTASHAFLALSIGAVALCFLLPTALAITGVAWALVAVNLAMVMLIVLLLARQWRS